VPTKPPTRPLRLAVPNKGSLSQAASDMLREAGYQQRNDAKQLSLTDVDNGVEFFYLRPRDIALYVGEGTLDVGITGRDLLLDSGAKAEEVLSLGFGRSRFHFAAPPRTAAGRPASPAAVPAAPAARAPARAAASRPPRSPTGATTTPSPTPTRKASASRRSWPRPASAAAGSART